MNYRSYIDQVMELPFINDQQAAESAIKTVLGVLTSKISDEEAMELTNYLPSELSMDTLRRHRQISGQLSVNEFFFAVGEELHLNWQEARDVVGRVFHCIKETEEGADLLEDMEQRLPSDWAAIVDQA